MVPAAPETGVTSGACATTPERVPTARPLPDLGLADVDEERRLFYGGLTRARYALFLTHAAKRRLRGKITLQKSSPFFG